MKYIICNLKNHLNNENIKEYIDITNKIDYEKLILSPAYKYIDDFKKSKHIISSQDYYEKVHTDYVIINHHERKNSIEEVITKLENITNENIILCVGNNDLDDYKNLDKMLNLYINKIKSKDNLIIAYEPYYMIGSYFDVDMFKLNDCIKHIKKQYKNIIVVYGGNVNEKNIEDIIKICDGVMIARLSYNPHKLTKIINNIKNSL